MGGPARRSLPSSIPSRKKREGKEFAWIAFDHCWRFWSSLTFLPCFLSHPSLVLKPGEQRQKKKELSPYPSGAICRQARTGTLRLAIPEWRRWRFERFLVSQRCLLDHRVLLTLDFVPCALALASFQYGCITMLCFCTWEANWDFLSET